MMRKTCKFSSTVYYKIPDRELDQFVTEERNNLFPLHIIIVPQLMIEQVPVRRYFCI